ncbi:MAG TPA: hypothetical protein PKX38_06055 [Alphaproteobacteria bacterium]|nr:hypothetical protein [Micavibrio sp.]MBK9561601.1 hypothetical protein [Micavibrio sp.]HQX27482.1 hypothetical protein [Alphaproteobacteria bacterium]
MEEKQAQAQLLLLTFSGANLENKSYISPKPSYAPYTTLHDEIIREVDFRVG